jgi:hypothetical protein
MLFCRQKKLFISSYCICRSSKSPRLQFFISEKLELESFSTNISAAACLPASLSLSSRATGKSLGKQAITTISHLVALK